MHINLLVKTLDHTNDLSSETDLTVLIVKVTTSKIKPKPWIFIHIIHSRKPPQAGTVTYLVLYTVLYPLFVTAIVLKKVKSAICAASC